MRKHFAQAFFLTLALIISIWAQTPVSPVKPSPTTTGDDVIRITANLVQLDVTVTDRDGRQVTDLKPEDFEVREEGRGQQITNFSYVEVSPQRSTPVPGEKLSAGASRVPPPPESSRVRADQVRRTMAVLVDDGRMSFGSVGDVRDTLRKFVTEQIEAGDLVGIFRTTGGNRMLQQFTVDRNQLALAARRLVWQPTRENSIDPFETIHGDFAQDQQIAGRLQTDPKSPVSARAAYFDYVSGDPIVIPALRFLINDMRKLPGRKSIVLFSDGLGVTTRTLMLLRFLTDYANRSGVVIYVVDARGLVNNEYVDPSEVSAPSDAARRLKNRGVFASQNGLNYLAEKTGGTFAHNNNDLGKGLRNALEERRGYYLIGYRPSEDTFKDGVRGFRKIAVKLKRPGLRVRTREGFVGIPDDVLEVPKRPPNANSPLYQVLASPLTALDIPVRLTPVFGQDVTGNSFLRALLHIDGRALNFVDEANGMKRLKLDVAAVTFGQDGRVIDEFTRTHTVRFPAHGLALIQQNGLVYSTDTPVRAPGAYQFRIVVRDTETNKFGTATQFIEIPDLKKGQLSLSSIILTEVVPGARQALPPAAPAEAALSLIQSPANPAVRRFAPGISLSYDFLIYNSQIVSGTRKPQITTQARLFHEGREVFAGSELVFDPGQQIDWTRLNSSGVLPLNPALMAGDYILQITVKDQAAGKKARVATQSIDFEIVK